MTVDTLIKDITREAFGAQEARDPTSPQPPYCIDVITETQGWEVVFVPDPHHPGTFINFPLSTGTISTVVHTCFPGFAGEPGSPGTPATHTTTFNLGWTGGAISIDSLAGDSDGIYQFSVPAGTVGIVTGFNDQNLGQGYSEIEHGFYCASGAYQIIESGVALGAAASFTSSDVFALVRLGNLVMYFLNTTLVYTSTVYSYGTVFIDASMYCGGDEIIQ